MPSRFLRRSKPAETWPTCPRHPWRKTRTMFHVHTARGRSVRLPQRDTYHGVKTWKLNLHPWGIPENDENKLENNQKTDLCSFGITRNCQHWTSANEEYQNCFKLNLLLILKTGSFSRLKRYARSCWKLNFSPMRHTRKCWKLNLHPLEYPGKMLKTDFWIDLTEKKFLPFKSV